MTILLLAVLLERGGLSPILSDTSEYFRLLFFTFAVLFSTSDTFAYFLLFFNGATAVPRPAGSTCTWFAARPLRDTCFGSCSRAKYIYLALGVCPSDMLLAATATLQDAQRSPETLTMVCSGGAPFQARRLWYRVPLRACSATPRAPSGSRVNKLEAPL